MSLVDVTDPALEAVYAEIEDLRRQREEISKRELSVTHDALTLGLRQAFIRWPRLRAFVFTLRESEYNDEGPEEGIGLRGVVYGPHRVELDYLNPLGAPEDDPATTAEIEQVVKELHALLEKLPEEACFQLIGSFTVAIATRSGLDAEDYYSFDFETHRFPKEGQ